MGLLMLRLIFIIFFLSTILFVFDESIASSEQSQISKELKIPFRRQLRHWDPMTPFELIEFTRNIMDFFELRQPVSTYVDAEFLPVPATLMHFLKADTLLTLFDRVALSRDPTKLCPLEAFVVAILERLPSEFSTIRGTKKWRKEVNEGINKMKTELSNILVESKGIAANKCLKWKRSKNITILANLIEIEWEVERETIPEFVLDLIKTNLSGFFHEQALSIEDRIELVEYIEREPTYAIIGHVTFSEKQEEFPYKELIEGLEQMNLDKLIKELRKNLKKICDQKQFLMITRIFEYLAKISELKVLLASLDQLRLSQLKQGDVQDLVKQPWHQMPKAWQEKILNKSAMPGLASIQMITELYRFGVELSWQLESAIPMKTKSRDAIRTMEEQKLPFRHKFHEQFANFEQNFEQYLNEEMPFIHPEQHLTLRRDTCRAWLIWLYEQQRNVLDDETIVEEECDVMLNS